MTSSLKTQRLADNFLSQFVELLSILAPHLRSIYIGATFIVGLCGDKRETRGVKVQVSKVS